MDNDELDELVISSSGRKRKIKAETFSWIHNNEGKLCVIIIYDHNNNNVCQVSTSSSEEITKIKPVFV